uniref:Endonuclease/exonuclease/phosphatase domain-containing protein n=1 Tax=Tetranychus urticae TaxID=32264 RepID=T1K484_TETUR
MVSAITLPVGIGCINTPRLPDLRSGDQKTYWTVSKCTVSWLSAGGRDKYGTLLNQGARALIIVGDFNATRTICPNTVARYDYILYSANVAFSRKLEDLETIQSDHKVIFCKLQITSNPSRNWPFAKYKDKEWLKFGRIVVKSQQRF